MRTGLTIGTAGFTVIALLMTALPISTLSSPSPGDAGSDTALSPLAPPEITAASRNYVNGAAQVTTSGVPVGAGDAVYVSVCIGTSAKVISASDSQSVPLAPQQLTVNPPGGTVSSQYTYVAANVQSSPSFTVSIGLSTSTKAMVFVLAISGVRSEAPIDAVGAGHAAAEKKNVAFSDTVTTSTSDDLGVLAVCSAKSDTLSGAGGSTVLSQGTATKNGWFVTGGVLSQLLPSSGSHALSASASGTATTEADALAFAPAGTDEEPGDHPIQHVVFIVLENEQISQVWKYGPYERYLAATYGNDSAYYATCTTTANYFAMVAGVTNQCGTDLYLHGWANTTLGDLLSARGLTWANYAESLSNVGGSVGACQHPARNSGDFVNRHVPYLHFANVTRDLSYCTSHILDASAFTAAVASGNMLNYSFYSANMCNDGHEDCTAGAPNTAAVRMAQVETWLKGFLEPMLNGTGPYSSPASRAAIAHTAFFIVYDRAGHVPRSLMDAGYRVPNVAVTNNTQYCAVPSHETGGGSVTNTVCGGNVYMTIVSPYSKGLHVNTLSAHYSLPATVEWLFGLPPLHNVGNYDSAYRTTSPGFPVLAGLFSFDDNGY